jgi:predicted O-methyltransferase YrrM
VAADPVLLQAMSWAAELGVGCVAPDAGAVLRLLATTARAKTVVEIGTGVGVSGLWLLRGLAPDGVLTTLDIEPDHQAMARQSFAAAGFANNRARLIPGAARDVLPRLADGAYDLVFVDGAVDDYAPAVSAAHRLLRPSGVMIINAPEDRDARERLILGEVHAYVRDAPEWEATNLAGLLCATRSG